MEKKQSRPIPLMVQVQHGKIENYTKNVEKSNGDLRNKRTEDPRFPITRAILWNRTPTGKIHRITFSEERRIRMYLSEKTLILAAKHGHAAVSFLLGSFITESDGILLQVDRFDPGRNIQIQTGNGIVTRRVPTAVIPGDHTITVRFNQGLCKDDARSMIHNETIRQHIEILNNRCCKKHPVSVPDLFISHASCHYQNDIDELIVDFSCNTLAFATDFEAKPVNRVPIIPTALAKNLCGPLRLSSVQGTPKFGYLTMDQTRKLLLLLETDPKVDTLPLVGIWISGIEDVTHPYAWACCLKFLRADYIEERVMAPPSSFLLVHYPTSKGYPDFYECQAKLDSKDGKLFDLLSCKEQIIINSSTKPNQSHGDICLDLLPTNESDHDFQSKMSVLDDGSRNYFVDNSLERETVLRNSVPPKDGQAATSAPAISTDRLHDSEDLPTPRPSPKPFSMSAEPHPRTPSVPELSFIEAQPIPYSRREYNPRAYQELSSSENRKQETSQNILRSATPRSNVDVNDGLRDPLSLSDVDLTSGMLNECQSQERFNGNDDIGRQRNSMESERTLESNLSTTKQTLDNVKQKSRELNVDIAESREMENEILTGHEEGEIFCESGETAKDEAALGPNTMSVIAEHERQLFELREQIRVLLELKQQEERKSGQLFERDFKSQVNTSIQCSMIQNFPETASVSVGTGESLILNGSGLSEDTQGCDCCKLCQRNRKRSPSRRSTQSPENIIYAEESNDINETRRGGHYGNASHAGESCSLSDIREADIHLAALSANQVSTSMQSFASDFQTVDLPVFDDSQNNEPNSPDDVELGASASMIYENKNQQSVIESLNHSSHADDDHIDPLNQPGRVGPDQDIDCMTNEETKFYQQMVEDVKCLLSVQQEEEQKVASSEEEDKHSVNGKTINVSSEMNEEMNVANGTAGQLCLVDDDSANAMDDSDFTVETSFDNMRLKNDTIIHPRINYVSMLGNEVMDDANALADEIARKYLTSNQMHEVQCSVRQKTKSVKFEGIYDDLAGTPRVNMNLVSVNVSCNMSLATRRYMQKYDLLEGQPASEDTKTRKKYRGRITYGKDADRNDEKENDEQLANILDLSKLKCLPKLK